MRIQLDEIVLSDRKQFLTINGENSSLTDIK